MTQVWQNQNSELLLQAANKADAVPYPAPALRTTGAPPSVLSDIFPSRGKIGAPPPLTDPKLFVPSAGVDDWRKRTRHPIFPLEGKMQTLDEEICRTEGVPRQSATRLQSLAHGRRAVG